MPKTILKRVHVFMTVTVSLALLATSATAEMTKAELGELLFFDTNLSKNRTQACATCHNPDTGFADARDNASMGAMSLGDDGSSLGDRSAPTASYAKFSPAFHKGKDGKYRGGQFWDGRAATLADQAGGPPLAPPEMAMPNKAAVVERIQENEAYVEAFKVNFGEDIFSDPDAAYGAMTKAIEAFEQTDFFAPFDSKYDRYLKGEYKMTLEEELGMTLFFSNQFSNCRQCHQLRTFPEAPEETFTNYEYHNIGVPVNHQARSVNGVGEGHIDDGLLANPAVNDPKERGKFKTPTLRNVAVTGPYMHNGVFKDLKTVVVFYNKYNSKASSAQINPETGKTWDTPEVEDTISLDILQKGDALDERRVNAIVAFLKTLTDKRYEDLLTAQ